MNSIALVWAGDRRDGTSRIVTLSNCSPSSLSRILVTWSSLMPIKPILAHLPKLDTSVTLLLNVMCATHILFALSTVLVMIEENPHDW
jgi:hypothetical protein